MTWVYVCTLRMLDPLELELQVIKLLMMEPEPLSSVKASSTFTLWTICSVLQYNILKDFIYFQKKIQIILVHNFGFSCLKILQYFSIYLE